MSDTTELSYFQQRMAALGITPEINKIELWQSTQFDDPEHHGENILVPMPIFREVEKGIEILVYTLQRYKCKTYKDAQRSGHTVRAVDKDYTITRLEVPIVKKDGSKIKYLMPKGEPTKPFFPPRLVKQFDEKTRIEALYITEGYFKAFKAGMHGIDCVGVPSITCLRDKETDQLHGDILHLIEVCQVQRLVWLTDGDFMNITAEIKEEKDLYTRPNGFYNSTHTFYELTSKFQGERYFAHINTDSLTTVISPTGEGEYKPGPKGLDDLLCALPGEEHAIFTEFNNFSIMAPGKVYPGKYITRICISLNTAYLRKYILKDDVTAFYLYHLELRKELKDVKTFKYNGTTYRYDEKEGKCIIEKPKRAGDYIRVGNDFYETIEIPTKFYSDMSKSTNEIARVARALASRQKSTITDDNGKEIFKHIAKYNAFCVVPDHVNYQPIIHNCYNLYKPFKHEPEEGACEVTLDYLKHVFGTEPVTYMEGDTLEVSIPRYELGLDYLTILYKYPQQILPILCLVSRERQTGKTTFINWLDKVFSENVITIGNEDMQQDFNAHWVSKLLVCCDETKLDKHEVIQKIKRLSTADKIVMNAKGKDQVELEFFAKFILMSNDEDDFIRIDREEIRFWVIKVPVLKTINTRITKDMIDEIPAFLHYLNKRQMVTEQKERHWFDNRLLATDALQKVKMNSLTGIEKRVMIEIAELFEECDEKADTLRLPLEYITKDLVKHQDKTYVKKILNRMGYVADKVARFDYPVREKQTTEGGKGYVYKMVPHAYHGRYYEFTRAAFTDVIDKNDRTAVQPETTGVATPDPDLPF